MTQFLFQFVVNLCANYRQTEVETKVIRREKETRKEATGWHDLLASFLDALCLIQFAFHFINPTGSRPHIETILFFFVKILSLPLLIFRLPLFRINRTTFRFWTNNFSIRIITSIKIRWLISVFRKKTYYSILKKNEFYNLIL